MQFSINNQVIKEKNDIICRLVIIVIYIIKCYDDISKGAFSLEF